MKLFPPIVNTLMIETEIEQQLKDLLQGHKPHPSRVEAEMKSKITQIYNFSSKFFWYPPKELLTEKTFAERDRIVKSNEFPGFGIPYT